MGGWGLGRAPPAVMNSSHLQPMASSSDPRELAFAEVIWDSRYLWKGVGMI